jgi:dihydroxyacetone kinase-like predicted kinase
VILSQILRGIASVVADADGVDATSAASALAAAAKAAYEAVMRPVEGTILTVVREASEAAVQAADGGADLVSVLDAARAQGADALERTPEMLPVLKDAGVVDAGGTGFLLLLDVLLHVTDGRPVPVPEPVEVEGPVFTEPLPGHAEAGEHGDISDLRYEVMYVLEAHDDAIPAFKDVWAGIGDSIVVVGGDGIWNCHIHTDDIGASIEAAIDIGTPRKIRVTDLLEQVEEEKWVREAVGGVEEVPAHLRTPVTCAVVAVATGAGIRRIFHSLGVQGIVTGGQSMNPSTAELIAPVEQVPADPVVILPNNKNIIPVAEFLDSETT